VIFLTEELKDTHLLEICEQNVPVTVILTNGVQLKGVIKEVDKFMILLENKSKQQFVYKHIISTIIKE